MFARQIGRAAISALALGGAMLANATAFAEDAEKTVLTRMFEWWNVAYNDDEPMTAEGFSQYFTDDIVFVINGRRSEKGLQSLAERFNALKPNYPHIRISLPMREEFAEGDKIFTYHVNQGRNSESDPWSGETHDGCRERRGIRCRIEAHG